MTKATTKIQKALQERIIKRKTSVTKKELTEMGIDLNVSPQKFGNVILKKDFFGEWGLSIENDLHDLDGNPIAENKKLKQILKANYENGKKEIEFTVMHQLNIWTSKVELKVGNFRLNSFLSSSRFTIELIDKKRNTDNLWIDSAIDKEKIFDVFHKFNVDKKELEKMKEVELNKKLEDHFKDHFALVKKGGSTNKGLVDLVLGENTFGIELKLARELKKTDQADRAHGQIGRYKEEFKSNFMMVIAGTLEDKQERAVQDLMRKLKETNTYHYYIEAH